MISDHDLVVAAAATYDPGRQPIYQSFNGAIRAFMSVVDGLTVIAVEGTHDPLGWALDFLAIRADANEGVTHPALGFVHAGFLLSAQTILPAVTAAIGSAPYALSGHSLGGALALLLGGLLIDRGVPPTKIGAFAPPRVGAIGFVKVVTSVPCSGYIFGNDMVPDVPFTILPAFPYAQIPLIAIGKPMADRFKCHAIQNYVAGVPAQ